MACVFNRKIGVGLSMLALGVGSAHATVVLNDGGSHVFNTFSAESIVVENSTSGLPTHLEVRDGAHISDDSPEGVDISLLVEYGSSLVINGGTIEQDLVGGGNSTITVNNGLMEDDLIITDLAYAAVYGGVVVDDIEVRGEATLDFYAGEVLEDFEAVNIATANVYGGEIHADISAENVAEVNVYGGVIGAGSDSILESYGNGLITLFGSDFQIDGVDAVYGAITDNSGVLSGKLADGSAFEMDFERIRVGGKRGEIFLAQIPEPASLVLLGLGCLMMVGRKSKPSDELV